MARKPDPIPRRGATPPTLRDIASRVGVSQGTVSATLNNAPRARYYSEETKRRIREVAEDLGYVANPLGRVLRQASPRTIGCISFNQPDIYYGHLLRGAEEEFRDRGYEPILVSMNYDRSQMDACFRRVAAWRVQGLLLFMGGRALDADVLRDLEKLNLPHIIVDAARKDNTSPCSRLNRESGRIMARHLVELGHRHIGVLGVNHDNSHTTERLEGILSVLDACRIALPPQRIVAARPRVFGPHAGYVYAGELVERDKQVTALMCINDILAIGAMNRLYRSGIRIPEDVSVAGFDDVCVDITVSDENRLGNFLWPSLTTVRVPHREMGRRAAAALVEGIGMPERIQGWQLDAIPELIVRDSTGPAAL